MMVEDYNLRVVLSALVSKSPSLSSLMLEGSGHPSSLDPIMELPDLRVMNLYSFDSNVSARLILSFKDMKNLRELHLSLPNAADFFVVESATGFLALEELFLEGELPCIAQFLETVESKKLLWIHLILVALPVDESLRTEQFEQFHLVLERFADCLERIDIIYKLLPHIKANIVEFLRPFDKLHELRTLNIDLRPSVKLDAASEDITQLFEAWPNLESFAVYASENSRGMPISVLSSVAEFCPLLEFIALPKLDIRPLKELKLQSIPIQSHGLAIIKWGGLSPLDPSTEVIVYLVQYLDHLFPNLRLSTCMTQEECSYDSLLRIMLSALQTARNNDRKRPEQVD